MEVLKLFLMVCRSRMVPIVVSISVFIAIFTTIALSIGNMEQEENGKGYLAAKANVMIIDEDKSQESFSLSRYLESLHNVSYMDREENTEEIIQDKLFYRAVDYVLNIPAGYGERLRAGETEELFFAKTIPGSFKKQYIDSQLISYISNVSAYISAGFDSEQAGSLTENDLSDEGLVEEISFNSEVDTLDSSYYTAYYYYDYIPYLLMIVLLTTLTSIIAVMNRDDPKRRTVCSPVSVSSYTLQCGLGVLLLCGGVFLVLCVVSVVLIGGERIFSLKGLLSTLNGLVFLLFCAAACVLVGGLLSGKRVETAVSMVANVVGLGMSFLCGTIVPQSILGDGIITIAKFLPAYWYVRANNIIWGADGCNVFDTGEIALYLLVELLFAAAVMAVSMAINKAKKVSA